MIGEVFRYDGALFVALDYDWDVKSYLNLCITTRNPKYSIGGSYKLADYKEVDELITERRLRSFIPKNIDYEEK